MGRYIPDREENMSKIVVISGGTDGMGRAVALARAEHGDDVIVIGSNAGKGQRLVAESRSTGARGTLDFIQADLASIAETRRVIEEISARTDRVDALGLFANRQSPQRVLTDEGIERTFALYYVSRFVLSHELSPLLQSSPSGVIINVAGVGMTKGSIHWDDLHLSSGYSTITAQLQAGRANDLLGAAYAAQPEPAARYVLFHPGFTRSGDLSPLPLAARAMIRAAALLAARSVEAAIEPIHGFIENPPADPLTANDRGRPLPLSLPTLDQANAERLVQVTRALLADVSA